ncbi:hypothetical protein [Eleftheria terrae]|uniref:hypothetical protein n=1 Tax=Eleftheria terrae TaxID=1597781 RepID=UPI00263BC437|nr:hypothetical protein [Eleftheria terrae]WKB55301.1 hypothetical protein N7L95_24765 [Eleftheria terrae]
MPLQNEIAAVKDRIAKAHSACSAWRFACNPEKYAESMRLVERLERQLDQLHSFRKH